MNLSNHNTKAVTLEFLSKHLKKSKIEKLYYFTVQEWQNDECEILNKIKSFFHDSKFVIVRSSAIGEDSAENSSAGVYESILNIIPSSTKSLKNAIKSVINSYEKKENINLNNQILIQNQSLNVIVSGVIFTKTPDIGAPYYVINYEEGGTTHRTTSGLSNNLIKIFRLTHKHKLEPKWRLIITAIEEIEYILQSDSLDIEFGFTSSDEVVIFQVRPLTFVPTTQTNLEKEILKEIKDAQKQFLKLNKSIPHIIGSNTIFSDMADWNPSEIIGDNPHNLDYWLYDFLVMHDVWYKGRVSLGYQNVEPYNLMVRFGNKPYVDVRGSFNSMLSQNLNKKLKRKLVTYYLKKLKEKPFLHDKIEFEILFSCYDLTVEDRLHDLLQHDFTVHEIDMIKKQLLLHTNSIMNNFDKIMQKCDESIKKLHQNKLKILSGYDLTKKNYIESLKAAELLLKDCRDLGTIPFSEMARIAFIATAILRSLVKKKHLEPSFLTDFMQSINTPLTEFQNDFSAYANKKIPKYEFLKKYGHLRPGTYDITAMRYDKQDSYFNIRFTNHPITKKVEIDKKITNILKKHGLEMQVDLTYFVKQSIAKREFIKFAFTHNLSDALELFALAGKELGFQRDDIANLDLKSLFSYKKLSKNELIKLWSKKIKLNKRKTEISKFLALPPIITSKNDFEIIKYYYAEPNYITEKIVTAELLPYHEFSKTINLKNKIILLENADPGYDWIFTRKPAGLITKYGGVASHMAIRCAEIGLPAAIGCGEIIFEKLLLSSKALLDCKNKEIMILEHKTIDEYVEERKILKTLGYIK